MAITFTGSEQWISKTDLQAGQLISFGYSSPIATVGDEEVMGARIRWGIIVTPVWKDNCDCYAFDSKEEVPDELLDTIARHPELPAGRLYSSYGDTYTFKSFKLDKMMGIRNHPFTTYSEDDVEDEVLDGKLTIDMEAGTITGPDRLIDALLKQAGED